MGKFGEELVGGNEVLREMLITTGIYQQDVHSHP